MFPATPSSDYDVIVVGARPAGASTAMLLARRGHRVLVLDRTPHGSDTLSTLAIMRAGVTLLDRWGLLARLEATGTPPLHATTFHYGARAPVRVGMTRPLYAPRRTVLDSLMADAAAEAGAEVHRRVQVTGLLRDPGGGVRGVRARQLGGREVEIGARLVIGADGRNSTVAREVAAPVTRRGTAAAGSIYTFVRGMDTDGLEWLYAPGASAGIIPTTDDETCVFVGTTARRFRDEAQRDLPTSFYKLLLEVSPDAADRITFTDRTAPFRGFPGLPGWLRRPHGPGWALVGDAGYFKDPATAHGIADALRDAELLARAADDGLTGRRPMAQAMGDYEAVRDDLSLALFDTTDRIAAVDWTIDDLADLHLDLSAAMKREARHVESLDVLASA